MRIVESSSCQGGWCLKGIPPPGAQQRKPKPQKSPKSLRHRDKSGCLPATCTKKTQEGIKLVRTSSTTAPHAWPWGQIAGYQATTQNAQPGASSLHLPAPLHALHASPPPILRQHSLQLLSRAIQLQTWKNVQSHVQYQNETGETMFNSTRKQLALEMRCSRQEDRAACPQQ